MTATKSGANTQKSSSLVKSTLRPTPRLSTWKTIPPGECRLGRDIHGFLPRYPSFVNLVAVTFSVKPDKGLRLAQQAVAHHLPTDTWNTDPDLAAVVAAWSELPEAIKAGILAMVKAAQQTTGG